MVIILCYPFGSMSSSYQFIIASAFFVAQLAPPAAWAFRRRPALADKLSTALPSCKFGICQRTDTSLGCNGMHRLAPGAVVARCNKGGGCG
jgi:hypothetical protein